MFDAHRFLGWLDEGREIIAPIRCPRSGCGHVNESIDTYCSSATCEHSLVRWPAWMQQSTIRFIFVNGVRSLGLVVAIAAGHARLGWAAYPVIFLFALLYLALLLREHRREYRELTWIVGAAFIAVGLCEYVPGIPVQLDMLVWSILPTAYLVGYVGATIRLRERGRSVYFPYISSVIGLLVGCWVLLLGAYLRGDDAWLRLFWLAQAWLASMFLTGVLVGGVVSGVRRRLPRGTPAPLRFTPIARWHLDPPERMEVPDDMPRAMRRLFGIINRIAYAFGKATVAIANSLTGLPVAIVNTFGRTAVTLANVLQRLTFRVARRLQAIIREMVAIVRDGSLQSWYVLRRITVRIGAPIAAGMLAAGAASMTSKALRDYIWNGDGISMGLLLSGLILIIVALVILVASQTGVGPARTTQAVLAGLQDPAAAAILLLLPLAIVLETMGNVPVVGDLLGPNPYAGAPGPVTIILIAVLIGTIVFMYVSWRRQRAEGRVRTRRPGLRSSTWHSTEWVGTGTEVLIAPSLLATAILTTTLVVAMALGRLFMTA